MPLPPRRRSNFARNFIIIAFGLFFGDLAWFYFASCAGDIVPYDDRIGCTLGRFLQQDVLLAFRHGAEVFSQQGAWFGGIVVTIILGLTYFFKHGAKKVARANIEAVAPHLAKAAWDSGPGWEKVSGLYRGRLIDCYAGSGYEIRGRRDKIEVMAYLSLQTDVGEDLVGMSFKMSGWYVPQHIFFNRSRGLMAYDEPWSAHWREFLSGRSTLTPEEVCDRLDHLCDVCDKLRDGRLPL